MTGEEQDEPGRLRRHAATMRGWIWQDQGDERGERVPMTIGPRIKHPVGRVHDGSALLARRWARWVWPEPEDQQSLPAALRRLAGTGGVTWLAGTAVLDSPVLMWPAVAAWCTCAYRTRPAAEPEPEQPAEPADEDAQNDPETDTADEPTPALPLGPDVFTERVRGRLHGHRAVHLAELADDLDTDIPTVRAMADAASIPVRDTRSSTRTGSTVGIRADDLPAPSPLPERGPDGVVGAGQPDVNNNNAIVDEIGQGGYVSRDPAETAARRHAA